MSAPVSVSNVRQAAREWGVVSVLTRPWVWVLALSLLGLVLRRYHLGAESLWFDEADIVRRAQQPLSTLIAGFTQAGENGPLYTLMLHFWLSAIHGVPAFAKLVHMAFGTGDEAPARALSAVFGAAGIPLIYGLGKRVAGWQVGLLSAALLTINPFDIWYSQDAKMYPLLVFASLASSLLYIAAFERGSVRLWVGYVLVTWVMLTVHSLSGLVLLAQLVATPFLWSGIKPRPDRTSTTGGRQRWVRWGWAMLLILAPIFPIVWLRAAALFTGTVDVGGWYSPTGLTDILSTILVNFAVNRAGAPWETIGSLVMLGLAIFGVVVLLRRSRLDSTAASEAAAHGWRALPTRILAGRSPEAIYLLSLWLVPVLAFWVVTLKIPLFQSRYLLMALPPYLIFASAGILALRRFRPWLPLLGVLLLALPTGTALAQVNYSPQVQKEDWRGAMAYVQDHLRLRDVIVVFPGYLVTAVDYYYHPGGPGNVPQVDIKTIPSLRTQGFGEPELNAALLDTVNCHERVWFITSPPREEQEDPLHEVQDFYQYNWHTFDTHVFNGVTVYGVAFNGQPNCWYPEPDHKEKHSFTNGFDFMGYIYELRRPDNKQPDASWVPLTLYWREERKINEDYRVRIVIKDSSGKPVVDEALGMLNGYWPTNQWPTDITIIDYRDLRLPGGLTPGDYTVAVQVYPKGQPDQPLQLEEGGTWIVFKAPLQVVPWKP